MFTSAFTARSGTTSELFDIGGGGNLRISGDHVFDFGTLETYNPQAYELRTVDGYKYQLDQDFGITIVVDPNGNVLQYSENGISHSDDKSIQFSRDANGRITQITYALGQSKQYVYNNTGYRIEVTDARGAVTTFTYDDNGNELTSTQTRNIDGTIETPTTTRGI